MFYDFVNDVFGYMMLTANSENALKSRGALQKFRFSVIKGLKCFYECVEKFLRLRDRLQRN